MIRLIDPVTFVVPGTAGALAPVVVEKFGAELRRAAAQFHHWSEVDFRVSQIGHCRQRLAIAATFFRCCVTYRALKRKMNPAICYTISRHTASLMMI